jgi:hypothetical protein
MNSCVESGEDSTDDPAKSRVIVFLDFDGVLHRYAPWPHDESMQAQYFSCLPRLESVLRDYPHVLVVVASDWRRHYSVERLRGFFSCDIRTRVIGTTAFDGSTSDAVGQRQLQAERYLRDHDLVGTRWIAVDDTGSNYRPDAPLILCEDLFSVGEEATLRKMLAAMS